MMIQAAATTMSSDKGDNNGEDGDQGGWQKTIVGAHYFWNKKIKIE